ncbi:uncharacterized protein LOC128839228 isoform X1 [Malaclemys terrapin pileata]|uniref:uncharacterized protein LOC128839228 isoform X1 n=1 Tax=Malaclemys terrapin pileata TaxID=2991368 RepID=UPI0023A7CC4E|nr:uncharacterized protein LOC128839228 isoform X1 [Malaclemys terrapin pileata]XP_053888001.1 uncharacterized protein LOC128839228 isoform X1 [Malaclemys terrapin pileata]
MNSASSVSISVMNTLTMVPLCVVSATAAIAAFRVLPTHFTPAECLSQIRRRKKRTENQCCIREWSQRLEDHRCRQHGQAEPSLACGQLGRPPRAPRFWGALRFVRRQAPDGKRNLYCDLSTLPSTFHMDLGPVHYPYHSTWGDILKKITTTHIPSMSFTDVPLRTHSSTLAECLHQIRWRPRRRTEGLFCEVLQSKDAAESKTRAWQETIMKDCSWIAKKGHRGRSG